MEGFDERHRPRSGGLADQQGADEQHDALAQEDFVCQHVLSRFPGEPIWRLVK